MNFIKRLFNFCTHEPQSPNITEFVKLHYSAEFTEPLFSKKVSDEYLVSSLSLRSNIGLFMLDHIRIENEEPIFYVRHISSDALIGMSEGAFQLLFEVTK